MHELRTSITGVIALVLIGLSFCLIMAVSFLPSHLDNTLKATVITGCIGLIGGCSAYYFTDTKRRGASGPAIEQADNVTVNNTPDSK